MKTIEENGKVYSVDEDTGLVVEARESEDFNLSDRVEVDGVPGKVISKTTSVYGPVVGVRFDSGETGEFLAQDLNHTSVEPIRFDTPLDQVKADWERYQELPGYTLEQVEDKARLARSLNVTAKALVTDRRTALSDQVLLDSIVISTGTDLLDMKEQVERLTVGESYSDNLPRYNIPNEIISSSSYSKDDASWLGLAAEEAKNDVDTFDWDSFLTSEALRATASLTKEQLESNDFMEAVASYSEERMPVGFNGNLREQFNDLLTEARHDALAAREASAQTRTAKVVEELADFNDAQLYL
jgi:hypothetical protein